jgi:hypothetical protein
MSIKQSERESDQKERTSFSDIMHTLEKGDGYVVPFSLSEEDLRKIRELLSDHLRKWLRKTISGKESEVVFKNIEIQDYHQISDPVNHREFMHIKNRELSNEARQVIQEMNFFKVLEGWFPNSTIEDPLGYRMNFRVARPDKEFDVFPCHADLWYWQDFKKSGPSTLVYEKNNRSRLLWVRDEDNKSNLTRWHVWIPICSESGLNGLKVAPRSQLRAWEHKQMDKKKYITAYPKASMSKYELAESEQIEMKLLNIEPGEVVLFHDGVVHQGALNRGQESRVALLFNIHVMK